MTQQYMLLFSLGPVQAFIAQARKTRDLWLGSYLLSVLMEAAMEGMNEQLVFPAQPTISGKVPDLPNRYIAIFENQKQATDAAMKSEKRIIACWKSIYSDVWNKIVQGVPLSNNDTAEIWKRQVNPNRFFEVFWVVVEGDNNNYAQWLSKTQLALAARKRSRHILEKNPTDDIEYAEVPEKGEKSTISGDREALRGSGSDIYRSSVRTFWQTLVAVKHLSPLDINSSGEERLDAIDTVKRFAYNSSVVKKKLRIETEENKSVGFPSTSSIATASFVEQLLRKSEEDNKSFLQEWLNVTSNESLAITPPDTIPYLYKIAAKDNAVSAVLERDGDCYFPETFVPLRLEKDYGISSEKGKSRNVASQGQQGLGKLLRGADQLGITRPTPYYAMIQMDGDKMGMLLGKVADRDEHNKISSALSEFSRGGKGAKADTISAKTLVEDKYPGRLIYAGGDDVFALAPLARDSTREGEPLTVLQLVDMLQQRYHEIVSPVVVGEERQQTVTASTGIAIAHHFTSLSYVRRASKEAESLAKKTYGRNSLVVTILRRSGEQTRVGSRWRYEIDENGQKTTLDPIDLFSQFYRLFKDDKLSPKCVYLLLEEVPALVHPSLFLEQAPDKSMSEEDWQMKAKDIRAMQKSEIKRVLRRQRLSKDDISDTRTEELAKLLVDVATAMDKDTRKSKKNEKQNLSGERANAVKSNQDEEQVEPKEKARVVELHSEERRYGLVEVLGWLQVMVFLTRKEQE